jgi:hypothetical protein
MSAPKDPKDTPQPPKDGQLDDTQLDNVSGGAVSPNPTTTTGGTSPSLEKVGGRLTPCI